MPYRDPERRRLAGRARKRRYYQRHKAEILARQRAANRLPLTPETQAARRTRRKTYYDGHAEEAKAASRAYHWANRERVLARKKAYWAQHASEVKPKKWVYRLANRERIWAYQRAYGRVYRQTHREAVNAWTRLRRAQRRGASVVDLTQAEWEAIKRAFGFSCAYCGQQPKRLTQDHVTPLSAGGAHTLSNIVPACVSCNSKKSIGQPLQPVQPLLLA